MAQNQNRHSNDTTDVAAPYHLGIMPPPPMPASPPSRYVRKQLSVTPEQDRALKRRSRELGVSEAELVRRALDAALSDGPVTPPAGSPLDELLAHTRDLGEGRRLEGGGTERPSTMTGATGAAMATGQSVAVARYLLDTNVLVYGVDGRDPDKQDRALDVLARVGRPPAGPLAALPAQALAEFSRVTMPGSSRRSRPTTCTARSASTSGRSRSSR